MWTVSVIVFRLLMAFGNTERAEIAELEVQKAAISLRMDALNAEIDANDQLICDTETAASLYEIEQLVLTATEDRRRDLVRALDELVAGGAFLSVAWNRNIKSMVERWESGEELPVKAGSDDSQVQDSHSRFIKKILKKYDRSW